MIRVHGGNAAWRAFSDEEPDGPAEPLGCETVLERIGFYAPERVAMAAQRAKPLTPKQAQRAAIKWMRKGGCGRRGLPEMVVKAMWMDYLRLSSLSKCGRLYRRTRQSMYKIFRRARLPLNQRNFQARILFGGLAWTQTKDGYFRPTTGDRSFLLHHEIWKARTGRLVPDGWEVGFANGDSTDFSPRNLVCLPGKQMRLLRYWRRFPERRSMSEDQRREFWRTHNRLYMREKAARFVARGLRSDGKPLKRGRIVRLEAAA